MLKYLMVLALLPTGASASTNSPGHGLGQPICGKARGSSSEPSPLPASLQIKCSGARLANSLSQ